MIVMETAVGKVCLTSERKAMSMMTSLSQRETTQPVLREVILAIGNEH